LIGHLIIGIAPHTSAGIIGRIIGFSESHTILAHPYWHDAQRRDCDGEETSVILAMDAFLNFSREFLPAKRGGTMDAPLVVSTILNPEEIDDEVYDVDTCWGYPIEFYKATLEYKEPWSVKIEQIRNRIGKPQQYEGMGYTHKVSDINLGVISSSYKTIPTMVEKMEVQMELANKIRAVDAAGVAGLVIEGHFIRDIKGNLRKFTQQEFRCVSCNTKYRRPPLSGICSTCGGKLIFTISEGTLKKYLEPSLKLANDENVPKYIKQTLELVKNRIETIFGKEKTKQMDLSRF
jgi:DNA polymerase II large subunit